MQKNKFTHLVVMRPTGAFYFGGENTFNTVMKSTRNRRNGGLGEIANYFAKSRYWPQQTALLGLLRHAMLLHHREESRLDASPIGKAEVIGAEGFSGAKPVDFRSLKGLSPVFFLEAGPGTAPLLSVQWHDAGLDNQVGYKLDNDGKPTRETQAVVFEYDLQSGAGYSDFQSVSGNHLIGIGNYSSKLPFLSRMSSMQNGIHKVMAVEDFFCSVVKTGVRKKASEDGFYKQLLYKFKPGYAFAFYVEFEGEFPLASNRVMMPFGGDQTEVCLEFVSIGNSHPSPLFTPQVARDGMPTKITLLSDAYIDESFSSHCEFVIGDTVDFRYLISELAPVGGYYRGAGNRKVKRKINLLQRGSVLFTKKASRILALLEGKSTIQEYDSAVQAYRQIGYNYFKIEQ